MKATKTMERELTAAVDDSCYAIIVRVNGQPLVRLLPSGAVQGWCTDTNEDDWINLGCFGPYDEPITVSRVPAPVAAPLADLKALAAKFEHECQGEPEIVRAAIHRTCAGMRSAHVRENEELVRLREENKRLQDVVQERNHQIAVEGRDMSRLRKLLKDVGRYVACHGPGAVYNTDSCMRCDELKQAYEAAKGGAK